MDTDNKKTNSPLEALDYNVVGAFSYLIPFITGVVFFLMEKENKFIRFHAAQAVLFWIAVFSIFTLMPLMNMILIGYLIHPLLNFATMISWLLLMWKAYSKEEFEIPYLGKIAKDISNKK